jgi:hypothetical protein
VSLRKWLDGECRDLIKSSGHFEGRQYVSLGIAVSAALAASPAPVEKEPPYYVRAFWSPCRKYIVTACAPSPGSEIALVGDDGNVWEAIGICQDMTEVAALAQPQETGNE